MAYTFNAVSVGNTPTQILPADNGRKSAIIYNNGTVTVYIGLDSTVATSTGIPLLPQSTWDGSNLFAGWRGTYYGITSSSTADVRYAAWTP